MTAIDFTKVQTLEEFVFALGMCAVSLESIFELQKKAITGGYLQVEEREQVETIAYGASRVFHSIRSLVELMGDRAKIDGKKVAARLQKKNKKPKPKE